MIVHSHVNNMIVMLVTLYRKIQRVIAKFLSFADTEKSTDYK